jgi:hypothetical protein
LNRAVAAGAIGALGIAVSASSPDLWRVILGSAALVVGAAAVVAPPLHPLRQAEIRCGSGHIDVLVGRGRSRRVRASSLTGATTARTDKGILLTLACGTAAPLTLELENDADAAQVRRALGIGHGGFGTISWHGAVSGNGRAGRNGWILAGVLGLIGLVAAATTPAATVVAAVLAIALLPIALLMASLGLIPGSQPNIVMAPDGLRLRAVNGTFLFFPYGVIRGVTAHKGLLCFNVPPPHGVVAVATMSPVGSGGLSEEERAVIVAQVNAAADRARGRGPEKEDIRERLDVLRRRGEPLLSWLARLDNVGQTLANGAGYRSVELDVDALWGVLEDPEAEVELRVASARVLRHVGDEASAARLEAALSATRSLEERRLRVAVRDDLHTANEDLALLEAELSLEERHPAFAAAARQRGHR